MKFGLLSVLIYIVLRISLSDDEYLTDVKETIHLRLHRLASLVKRFLPPISSCNMSVLLMMPGDKYGDTGNNAIEFASSLWLSRHYNRTFVMPPWMNYTFHPFHLKRLHEHFCFITEEPPEKNDVFFINAKDAFFMGMMFFDPRYKSSLPAFSEQIFQDVARHYLLTFSAIWSAPSHSIVNATAWIIRNKMHGFYYTAVHKRSLDGGCEAFYWKQHADRNAFDPSHVDMTYPGWNGNLATYNPICDMPLPFVHGTMKLNHRVGQKIYVLFDGRGSIADYIASNATSLADLDASISNSTSFFERKFIDLFVAINADFFIMNPFSTFSYQANVIRTALGLETVPRLHHHDYFWGDVDPSPMQHVWLNADAFLDAYTRLKNEVHNVRGN